MPPCLPNRYSKAGRVKPSSRAAGFAAWYRALLWEMQGERTDPRRNRINPRVIKRKMSNWMKKRPEHRNYPQPTKDFRAAIVLLC